MRLRSFAVEGANGKGLGGLGKKGQWLPGRQPLEISIGRIPLALFLPRNAELRAKAVERYRAFSPASSSRASFRRSALPVILRGRSTATRAQGPRDAHFAYQLDDAVVTLRSSGAEFAGVRHEYALDSLIRILLTMMLLPRRGFLLHAATVVRDGKAYVFAGRSGAGKSTVSRLSPEGSVLTDEISLIRRCEGTWYAHGTPFWGEFRAAGRNERFPLAGIYGLERAPEDRVEPLTARDTLRALLPCVLFFNSDPEANRELLSTLVQLVEEVPCHRLRFRRDAAFWKVMAA